jgi:hypothetical protein
MRKINRHSSNVDRGSSRVVRDVLPSPSVVQNADVCYDQ